MGLYNDWIVPRLTRPAMSRKPCAAYRARALAEAHGRVLEIGIRSGLTRLVYGLEVRCILGVDPSPELIRTRPARRSGARPRWRSSFSRPRACRWGTAALIRQSPPGGSA